MTDISTAQLGNAASAYTQGKSNLTVDRAKHLVDNIQNITPEERKEVEKLAGDFESIFLNLVFKTMRETVSDSGGVLDASNGEKIFRSMLDNEYAKTMANQNTTGLGDMIAKDLLKTIETQKNRLGMDAYIKSAK